MKTKEAVLAELARTINGHDSDAATRSDEALAILAEFEKQCVSEGWRLGLTSSISIFDSSAVEIHCAIEHQLSKLKS